MTYTPFKMKGHSLPGIKQRATDPNPEKTQKRVTKNTQDNLNKNIQGGITTEQKGPQTPMEKEWEKRTRETMKYNQSLKAKKSPAKQTIIEKQSGQKEWDADVKELDTNPHYKGLSEAEKRRILETQKQMRDKGEGTVYVDKNKKVLPTKKSTKIKISK